MTPDVLFGARRRLPGVMVSANLAVATVLQRAQYLRRTWIDGDRVGDHVGRPDAVLLKQRMQPRQRVDVLEALIETRRRIPLVVAFRVNAN